MNPPISKPVKLKIGKEYEIQGKYCILQAIEGNEVVCRDRFDNVFTCEIGYVREKSKINK